MGDATWFVAFFLIYAFVVIICGCFRINLRNRQLAEQLQATTVDESNNGML